MRLVTSLRVKFVSCIVLLLLYFCWSIQRAFLKRFWSAMIFCLLNLFCLFFLELHFSLGLICSENLSISDIIDSASIESRGVKIGSSISGRSETKSFGQTLGFSQLLHQLAQEYERAWALSFELNWARFFVKSQSFFSCSLAPLRLDLVLFFECLVDFLALGRAWLALNRDFEGSNFPLCLKSTWLRENNPKVRSA